MGQYAEQCMVLHWDVDTKENFVAKLAIDVNNELGVIAKLLNIIEILGSNIEDLYMHRKSKLNQVFVLLIAVKNSDFLKKIMHRISGINAVNSIERVKN